MKLNKNEKRIVTVSVLGTIVITLGFTMMQGDTKFNQKSYVSTENSVEVSSLSKDDYEVISRVDEGKQVVYSVFLKREISSKEAAELIKNLKNEEEKFKANYEVCLFTDKDVATSVKEMSIEERGKVVEKLIVPVDESTIKMMEYSKVEKEIDSVPSDYEVISMKNIEGVTNIELMLKGVDKADEALAQIKFLGQNIKELNPSKNISILNIVAYTDEDKSKSFEYDGNYKDTVIKNQYEKIN
ncbi:hypothetical protein CHL78_009595 [Romboutsia weinsteinii]|uniref:Uncharacterized protein n=1 Tax=Romboutsia weinsteinii TaxID=2020949 RepID=A0A371J462_9FIRM|nr:hypothetical protein [Romboutsia weinsteinii]RDY27457.1 hypothetical protein CHL78_009595 [Romboutsia weinsteinii]